MLNAQIGCSTTMVISLPIVALYTPPFKLDSEKISESFANVFYPR